MLEDPTAAPAPDAFASESLTRSDEVASEMKDLLPRRVQMLGSAEHGMAIVHPDSDAYSDVLTILGRINQLLKKDRKVHQELDDFVDKHKGEDDSIRRIQGNRIEIFVEAGNKCTACFDQVLGKRLPPNAKSRILEYARHQASQDPRQQQRDSSYEYGNFSIICNFGRCEAQAPHIDLVQPNFQFGLILSNGSPGTLFYEAENHIQTVEALAQRWKNMAQRQPVEYNNITGKEANRGNAPSKLIEALEKDEGAKLLLSWFGDVLDDEKYVLSKMKGMTNLPTGSLLSLPGGVIHAGPRCPEFRAVIFFSGWKRGSDIAAYDPDVQYTGTMLAGHLTSILWKRPDVGDPERLYLLQRLTQYIEGSTVSSLKGHFGPGQLSNFVDTIETKRYLQMNMTKEEFLQKAAKNKDMNVPGDYWSLEVFKVTDFEQITVDGIFTMWDDNEVPVIIYRRISDNKIILRYPSEGEENADEYEGHRDDENFQLIMNGPNKQERFDGTNGRLFDTDGDEVKVYLKS